MGFSNVCSRNGPPALFQSMAGERDCSRLSVAHRMGTFPRPRRELSLMILLCPPQSPHSWSAHSVPPGVKAHHSPAPRVGPGGLSVPTTFPNSLLLFLSGSDLWYEPGGRLD